MRVSFTVAQLALAGAAFAVAGCGSRPAATNNSASATSITNDLTMPMNDASAMETVSNAATTPLPTTNASNAVDTETLAPPPSGNTTVQSNIAGM